MGASAQAQTGGPLLTRGEFALEFVEVLNADTIVPLVTRDEGVLKIVLDESVERYFTAQDVLSWIRNQQLRISMVEFRPNNVNLHPDGSITIRFQFQFLPSQEMIGRKVEIQVKDFSIYYQSHDFYRSKVNVYRLKVAKDPVRDVPKMATVTFTANQPGFNIDMTDASNVLRRYDVPDLSATFSNIPPGRYRIHLTKENFRSVILDDRVFVGDSSYVVPATFEPVVAPNIPVIEPTRRSRWWLWTLVGVAATSSTAYFLLQPGASGRLPGPPGPPPTN